MSEDIKKGLLGIVVDETEVSKVMPEINSLTYRGYAAQDLCEYCRFEEVAYLILNKDLPNTIQLRKFEKEEKNNRELSKDLYSILKKMPKKAHPMDVARTAVSIMGLEDKETTDSSPEANMRKAIRILAKTPTALAAFYRIRKGKKNPSPRFENHTKDKDSPGYYEDFWTWNLIPDFEDFVLGDNNTTHGFQISGLQTDITGLSSSISSHLFNGISDESISKYLTHFRADNIKSNSIGGVSSIPDVFKPDLR